MAGRHFAEIGASVTNQRPMHSHWCMTGTEDDELLIAAARGDADAFAEFYRRHVGAVTAYFRGQVGGAELAFDLTAETFARAVAGLATFDPVRGHARAWLFGIAVNELRQAWRRARVEDRARRELRLEPIVLDDDGLSRVDELSDHTWLAAALRELPQSERDAINARVIEDHGYDEIAKQLSCSEAVVRQRVSRGLRRLRALVEEAS